MLNKKGFTLIELLGVLVILGLVLVFTMPDVIKKINLGNKKTYEMLKENMKTGAESYVNECSTSSSLYKVYLIDKDSKINDISNKYNISNELICSSIGMTECDSNYLIKKDTVILIPYTCTAIYDKTTISAIELIYNGFLKGNKDKRVIRSVDNKDVSTCLKVEINYDEYSYKYSYIINDKECE